MYAEIAVNAARGEYATYSYEIPSGVEVTPGCLVWAPFGARLLQGVVFQLVESVEIERTKPITGVVGAGAMLLPYQLDLARWISSYYLTSLFNAAALMLPPGVQQQVRQLVSIVSEQIPLGAKAPGPDQTAVLDYLAQTGTTDLNDLKKRFGDSVGVHVQRLANRGLLRRDWVVPEPAVRPKRERHLEVVDAARATAEQLSERAPAQARALLLLLDAGGELPWRKLRDDSSVSDATLRAIVKRGYVIVSHRQVSRSPTQKAGANLEKHFDLTPAQLQAVDAIVGGFDDIEPPKPVLLHGVTGSGKTEVYLQAAAQALARNRYVGVLVPEIAQTPQIVDRFLDRFGSRVALFHSGLTAGEQFDEWRRLRSGEARIVIGARNAIFAPLETPGLIVIDEGHDWGYKQSDGSPRYDARTVAIQIGNLTGAVVVEGTATPAVETYHRAKRNVFRLMTLPERIKPGKSGAAEPIPLPKIEIVDMREELRSQNRSIFSGLLRRMIVRALAADQQVILFLNRRGTATYVQCRECGHVMTCSACETPLAYHASRRSLVCHQCNRRRSIPSRCPTCAGPQIRYLGIGTQRVLDEVIREFPEARALRWDRDAARSSAEHRSILERFRLGRADVLVGTQLVAKGLDLPKVTVVGIINADIGLTLPDFRAAERVFQLLSQAAGRAGRASDPGSVIIQTYNPEHYAIQAAAQHDYGLFFEREIAFRREQNNPPFARVVRLVFSHTNPNVGRHETEKVRCQMKATLASSPSVETSFVGPTPCYFSRIRGRYRWQIVLRGSNLQRLVLDLQLGRGWSVDVDPGNLL